jgi:hypothetical protein
MRWRWYEEPDTNGNGKNELRQYGLWWKAQYDDGTECSGECPLDVVTRALGHAKERA